MTGESNVPCASARSLDCCTLGRISMSGLMVESDCARLLSCKQGSEKDEGDSREGLISWVSGSNDWDRGEARRWTAMIAHPTLRLIGKQKQHTLRCAEVIWAITTSDLILACSDRLRWLCLGREAAFSRSVGRSVRVLPETPQASTAVASLYLSNLSASLSLLDSLFAPPTLCSCSLPL